MNEVRCRRLIDHASANFGLDLSGLVVLTEAATGYYILTPLIAALAGADHVYALTRDSRYGSAQVVQEQTMVLAQCWGVAEQIEVLFSREDPRIAAADVVTNLGFVRPLDALLLRRLKPTAVIPLMFETWEHRPEDLNLAECRRLGIPVAGTNEHHPMLQTFAYVGHLALKLLFELGIEVFRSRVVVIGGGEFGRAVLGVLTAVGAHANQVCAVEGELLRSPEAREIFRNADAVVVAENTSRETLIGGRPGITAGELRALSPDVVVAHISGVVDQYDLRAVGIPYNPRQLAPPGYMSLATDYLGPRPLIDLHTAGLKVGEVLARAVREGYSGIAAEERAASLCPLVQRFT